MSNYVGDYDTGTLVYGDFSTFNPASGASIQFVAGKLAVVKNIGGITNTAGVVLATSVGLIAGANGWSVDTSADGTAYSAGGFFSVIALAGTVNSVDIKGSRVGSFTLRKDSGLKPTTGGRTVDVATTGTVLVGGTVTVGTNNDKTGYSLNSSQTLVTIGAVANGVDLSIAALQKFFTQAAGAYASATSGSIVAQIVDNAGGGGLTVQDIVDGVWDANMATLPDTNPRSPLNAIRLLRNKWNATSNTLTVYEEDDTTIAWTSDLSVAPGADPVSGSDPT